MLAGACILAACAPPTLRDLTSRAGASVEAAIDGIAPAPRTADDAVLVFLAEAQNGEVGEIDDAGRGVPLRVRAGRLYHAASGRVCRRYREGVAAEAETGEEGLACRNASGRWARVELVIPASR